jgi:hypothetical protein
MQNEQLIKDNVAKAFESYPEAKEVYATSDGQVFLREDRARLHATQKGKVYPFNRADFFSEPEKDSTATSSKPLPAADVIEAIKTSSLKELEQYESDNRKTVKDALEKRKAQLISEIDTFSEQVSDEKSEEETDNGTGGAEQMSDSGSDNNQ